MLLEHPTIKTHMWNEETQQIISLRTGQPLKSSIDKKRMDYLRVSLSTPTIGKYTYMIHQFAWECYNNTPFIHNGNNLIRHLNDNKMDNSRNNLSLGTVKDNYYDMIRNGKKEFIINHLNKITKQSNDKKWKIFYCDGRTKVIENLNEFIRNNTTYIVRPGLEMLTREGSLEKFGIKKIKRLFKKENYKKSGKYIKFSSYEVIVNNKKYITSSLNKLAREENLSLKCLYKALNGGSTIDNYIVNGKGEKYHHD